MGDSRPGSRPAWRSARAVSLTALALACATTPARAQSGVRISEVFFACVNGDTTIQFIELENTGPDTVFASTLRLEYRINETTIRFNISPTTSVAGQPWLHGRHFLIANLNLTSRLQFQPDFSSSTILLSRRQGILTLSSLINGVRISLSQVRYGAAGSQSPPPDGWSLSFVNDVLEPVTPSPERRDGSRLSNTTCLAPASGPDFVISEVMFQCANHGTPGQFVELGLGGTPLPLTSDVGLRYYDALGALIADIPGVFAAAAGTPLNQSQKWLMTPAIWSWSGPADGTLPAPLDTTAGRIVFYRTLADRESVLTDLDYGPGNTWPRPHAGWSLARATTGSAYIERSTPTPTDRSGSPHVLSPACTRPPLCAARITEFQLTCLSGSTDGRFIELTTTALADEFDGTLAIRTYDHDGVLLGEEGDLFGGRTGQLWTGGQPWLVGTSAFAALTGVTPDTPLLLPLDRAGGRLVLVARSRLDGSLAEVDSLDYGGASSSLPAPGQSLVRTSSGALAVLAAPDPRGYGGLAFRPSLHCSVAALVGARINEFGLRCPSGSTQGRFVELLTTATLDEFDATLELRAYAHDGTLLGEQGDFFGAFTGTAWPKNAPWLLATGSYTTAGGAPADSPLLLPLDPEGGRLALVARSRADGSLAIVDSLDYGGAASPLPGPGESLQRTAAGELVVSDPPTPTGHAGAGYVLDPACRVPVRSTARVAELSLKCLGGYDTYQFIRLAAAKPDDVRDSTLTVRVFDHADAPIGLIANPFGARAGEAWPQGQNWFVGSPGWHTSAGAGPETVLPFRLDPAAGCIVLAARDRSDGTVAVVQELRYGTSESPAPGNGMGLTRQPDGRYAITDPASPKGSTGESYLPSPACQQPEISSARIDEFQLLTSNGLVAGQWITVAATVGGDAIDTSVVVRAFDRTGALIGLVSPALARRRNLDGYAATRLLIATPFWEGSVKLDNQLLHLSIADVRLPFVMDPQAGSLEVWARDRLSGVLERTQSVAYGPGGWLTPAPGLSLARSGGGFIVNPSPSPRGAFLADTAYNTAVSPPGVTEIFTACADGSSGVSYVSLQSPPGTPYYLSEVGWGPELRGLGADGVERFRDHVLESPDINSRLDPRPYLVTSPAFASVIGGAGDAHLSGALDPLGGRLQLGWSTPAGTFEPFHELLYGPGGVPAPGPGRAMILDSDGGWREGPARPVTTGGITFASTSCFGASGWPVVLREVFPSCRCSDDVSFVELATVSEPTGFEGELAFLALDRLGGERWRVPDLFSSRAGSPWPAGRTFLLASAGAKYGLLLGTDPDAVLPGTFDAEGGRVLVIRGAVTAQPETLADFAYGPGTPHPRSFRGSSFQRQASGTFLNGSPTPTTFDGTAPLAGHIGGLSCIGTGAQARLVQALWSCGDGAGGVSFLDFISSFGNFPDDMGVRAFGRDGTQIFRLEHPFALDACVPISYGGLSHWLLASAGMEQLAGQRADGVMPAPLDPVAGRIETFLATPQGDVPVEGFSYGGPGDPVVPLGYAFEPGPIGYARDAQPIRSDGHVLRTPSCIEDGPPVIFIGEVLLRCGDGGTDAQYVKLMGGNDPDFHDSRLRLFAKNRTGAELFHLDPLAPALGGHPIPAAGGLLMGSPALAHRIGLTPDLELPQPLDAEGGTLRLEWVRAPAATPTLLDEVKYGPGTLLRIPPAGMALRPHDDARAALHYLALPTNLAGDRPTSRTCFTDSCSAFALSTSYLGQHLAFPDSIRGTWALCESRHCATLGYDWSTLSVSAHVIANDDQSLVVAVDDFVAEGLPDGTPVSFEARFTAELYGYYGTPCWPYYCSYEVVTAGAGFSMAGVREDWSEQRHIEGIVTRAVTVRAGEPFRLVLYATARVGIVDDTYNLTSGEAEASLVPMHLPPGVTLRSCWGYRTPVAVAAEISLASASATRDAVRLEWRTSLGSAFSALLERRTEDSPWLPLATLLPDGLGALKYEDHDVRAGRAYDYRLHWSDGRGDHTSGVVSLRIPEAPSFAFNGAWPNPLRGGGSLSLVLDDSGPARLEFYDVGGRRAATQSLALEPGEHVVPIALGRRLPPGIYSVKLRQGAHVATRRVVVLP